MSILTDRSSAASVRPTASHASHSFPASNSTLKPPSISTTTTATSTSPSSTATHVSFRGPSPLRKQLTLDELPVREWRRSEYAPPTPFPFGNEQELKKGGAGAGAGAGGNGNGGFVKGLRRRASSFKSVCSRRS